MTIRRIRNYTYIALIAFTNIFAFIQCSTDADVYACDLFSEEKNQCTIKPGSVYEVKPASRPLTTWTDFAHHLYFHSGITPGLRVNRPGLSLGSNFDKHTAHTACYYHLKDPNNQLLSVSGQLEGFRVDANGIWCFDYFGSELLHFVRENQIADEKINLDLFPLELTISLGTGPGAPSIRRSIKLHLQ